MILQNVSNYLPLNKVITSQRLKSSTQTIFTQVNVWCTELHIQPWCLPFAYKGGQRLHIFHTVSYPYW